MRWQVDLTMYVEADEESEEEVRILADQAAKQIVLRLGDGPHSIARWIPGITSAFVSEAEFVLIYDPYDPNERHANGHSPITYTGDA
jgi:hypothetical protein